MPSSLFRDNKVPGRKCYLPQILEKIVEKFIFGNRKY